MNYITGFLIGVVIVLVGLMAKTDIMLTNTRTDIVYTVCNQSRVSADISETECGRLQDRWNREFLCSSNNTNPDTHCWVEVK